MFYEKKLNSISETKVEAKPKAVASIQPSNIGAVALVTKSPSLAIASTLLTNSTGSSASAASPGTANPAFPVSENAAASKKVPSLSSAKNEKSEEEEDELQKKSTPSTTSTKETNSPDTDSVDTASVRSILSRAKNILKTLDIGGSDSRKKRFRIARPDQTSKQQQKQQKQQWSKKMVIPSSKNKPQGFITNQKVNEYPDNFILKSWYGK